jgi:cell division protein ZapA (FtsZ GTPase activity inhibitor)
MSSSSKPIEVKILGQKMSLKSKGDPELVQEALDLALLRVKDVERRTKGLGAHQVALLALFDLAEEYVKAKRRATESRNELTLRSNQIVEMLENELK